MSNKIFYSSPRARFFDSNGNPLSNGRVSFYEAGTTTLKVIYTDITQVTPAQNPMLLDAEGYVRDQGIWLGGGRYKFKLDKAIVDNPDVDEDADFSELWTMDNIEGASVLNSGELSTIVVATIADLRGLTAGEYSLVYVAGYWEENDGGGGWFNYSPNENEADNGGTVIAPNGSPATGRYLRNLENWEVSVQYFGATSSSFLLNGNVVGAYCQNALTWCLANDRTLVFPADTYTFGSSQTFQGNLTIRVKENAVFTSDGTAIQITLSPTTLNVEGKTNHLGDDLELYFTPTTPTTFRPEHWGAVGFGSDSDADFKGFINANGRYGDSILVLSGDYEVNVPIGNPTTSFATQRMHIELGATLTTDLEFNMGSYTFAENLNSAWTFAKDRLKSLGDSVLYLDHFSIQTPISDSDFTYFKDAVTNFGVRHGSLKLLTGGDYPVVGITATPSYSLDLFVKVGNNITAVSDSQLPRISNGVNDFAILDSNGANIELSNNAHSIVWWGASSTSTGTSQLNGVKKALECASLGSNRGVVYGNNESLSLTSLLSATSLNVELRELEIESTSDLTLAGDEIKLNGCTLGGFPSNTLTASVVEVVNSTFKMTEDETLTLSATEELFYNANTSDSGLFVFTTGSKTNAISNNRFKNQTKTSSTGLTKLVNIKGGSNTSVMGNSFESVVPTVPSAGDIAIMYFDGSAEVVEGLSVKGNSFYTSVNQVVNYISVFGVTGYASIGHRASINGNTISANLQANAVLSYNPIVSDTVNLNSLPTEAVSPFDRVPFKGIFPYSLDPTFACASNTLNDGTFTLGTPTAVGGAYEVLVTISITSTGSATNFFKISCSQLP